MELPLAVCSQILFNASEKENELTVASLFHQVLKDWGSHNRSVDLNDLKTLFERYSKIFG